MKRKMRVLALGDLNLDVLCHINRWPNQGEDVLTSAIDNKVGGSTANTAAAFVACGGVASVIARVGHDFLAHEVLAGLEKLGVDRSRIQHGAAANTGMAFITVGPEGERTIFGYRGANAELDPDHIEPHWFAEFDLFHLSGYALLRDPQRAAALRALRFARDHSMPVSLDLGRAASTTCAELLNKVDVLLASLSELPDLCGVSDPVVAIGHLAQMGPTTVVVKLGSEGVLVRGDHDFAQVPAARVAVSDTTGAGDLFNAGFLYGYLRRMSPKLSAALGNGLAALGVATNGPGRPLPSGRVLVQWLEDLILPAAPPELAVHLRPVCQALFETVTRGRHSRRVAHAHRVEGTT